ncbi:MAG: NTP transferase domain-containing protein [Chthoniobacterales bacterium]|nr:NTP transferase domain-containing protein [Chthoniobacterales bacterium]
MDSLPMTLVVLAAGMGSRYGGLKQLDPVGPSGETLLDYSVYDAVRAGFSEIVFIIRKEIEEPFRKMVGDRYAKAFPQLQVKYVFQEMTDLAQNIKVSEGRTKPWGTGHALLAARYEVKTPFAVINADDYYGSSGYQLLAAFLRQPQAGHYAMVGYQLKNTLSAFGTVSRGITESTNTGFLKKITEQTDLRASVGGVIAQQATGKEIFFTGEELVSLNFWAFLPDFFPHLEKLFEEFLNYVWETKQSTTAEFYLPSAVNQLIKEETISVKLLCTQDPWFGLTYPDDLPQVKVELKKRIEGGYYPSFLF